LGVSFAISKVFWTVAAPGNLLLILLSIGAARSALTRGRSGRALTAFAAFTLLAIAVLPIGNVLANILENRFPPPILPARIDGVVVLGGAILPATSAARGQPVLGDAAERLTTAASLARRFPNARIVLTGGDGALLPHGFSEARAMGDLLVELGVDPARLVLEAASRTTWENAVLSHGLVRSSAGDTWVLVTSGWHMPRAIGCFRRAGWSVIPYPVVFRTKPRAELVPALRLAENLTLLDLVVKEWIGLIAYRILDRTDALFPVPTSLGSAVADRARAPASDGL
jgi:uncharacterized SAM-binding protein YcdF (DUF218 family)